MHRRVIDTAALYPHEKGNLTYAIDQLLYVYVCNLVSTLFFVLYYIISISLLSIYFLSIYVYYVCILCLSFSKKYFYTAGLPYKISLRKLVSDFTGRVIQEGSGLRKS